MATQKPTANIRIGNIETAIWKNETEDGMRENVTFKRRYKDGDGWKSSESFRQDDLLVLAKVPDTAHSTVLEVQEEEEGEACDGV